jgi:hypothetical protein
MDIPTRGVITEPTETDLIGFAESARVLSRLLSYSHDNALVPIKLVNSISSISQQPSGDILRAFAGDLFA